MIERLAIAFLSIGLCACDKKDAQPTASPVASQPAASQPAASQPTATAGVELMPGKSFGPLRLGMTKAEVDALSLLKVHPQYSGMTIPFTVHYDDTGKAKRIQMSLKHAMGDVKIGSLIIPTTATFESAKTLLGDCKDNPPAKGGTTSVCRGGAVSVSFGSGSPSEIWVELSG